MYFVILTAVTRIIPKPWILHLYTVSKFYWDCDMHICRFKKNYCTRTLRFLLENWDLYQNIDIYVPLEPGRLQRRPESRRSLHLAWKTQSQKKLAKIEFSMNIFWWGEVKVIYCWHLNVIRLVIHPINKYSLKIQFSPIFFLRCTVQYSIDKEEKANVVTVFSAFVCVCVCQ